ncbi:MAG: alpha/beta fold hydrolase [Candidatus Freyarchaeota archaeon]|nr:alpha/beta fold hydrolase [Candidatus Jordarchaeia archaeon]MBS7268597.1 alpha/beta fold hydrolase [Candidatus Jordarchaeia archaeon]MBS7279286.1 alpha/beta fold hydrolase [Candidatus Jordarchaeia archaeon]
MRANLEGFQMYYEDVGKGVPVVFIHGLGGDSKDWKLVIPELSKEIRCIAVDLRGHGQSDKPNEPYTQSLFARDVISLLNYLGIKRAYFCGASMGGYVAQKVALTYPQRVRGLILVGASPHIPEQTVKVSGKWAETLLTKGLEAFIEVQVKDVFHPAFARHHKEIIDIFRESKRVPPSEVSGLINKGMQIEPIDFRKRLREIKAPTLIIHGHDDQIVPVEYAELMHKQIPNSQLAALPLCGHLPAMERPTYFADLLLYFIEKTEKEAGRSK